MSGMALCLLTLGGLDTICQRNMPGVFDIYMVGGILTTFVQVIGIGLVLKWRNAADVGSALKTAAVLWLVFGLPITMYPYLYLPAHNSTLLMIDSSHLLTGWIVSAAIMAVME